jgi:hypothetical protein
MTSLLPVGALGLLLGSAPAAADPQSSYAAGLAATHAGDFALAQAHFEDALGEGGVHPAVYQGLGNALHRQGRLGPAVAAWARGARLAPRDGDLGANLERGRAATRDRLDPPGPAVGPLVWMRFLAVREAAALASALLSLGLAWPLAAALRGGPRPAPGLPLAIVGLGLLFGASAGVASRGGEVVVVGVPELRARSALGDAGVELFAVHEGAELRAVDAGPGHRLVELPDGRKGWVPEGALISADPSAPWSLPAP